MRELAQRFDEEHIEVHLKASTAKEYRRILDLFILPAIGHLRIVDVIRADIAKYHHDWRHRPYQANRNLEIIFKMFNLAERWGLRPDGTNPRKHIKKYPEKKRERYFSASELQSLGRALRVMENEGIELASAIAAVRLLLFTGRRLGEISRYRWRGRAPSASRVSYSGCGRRGRYRNRRRRGRAAGCADRLVCQRDPKLRWDYVDLPARLLRLPDSKTGAKAIHLGQPAIAVLEAVKRLPNNPFVITGRNEGAHLTDLQPFWQRARGRAGLKNARIHDLRHTFASVAVTHSQSLPMIGKLRGHMQVQTTARYAHLANDPVIEAANDVSSLIVEQLLGAAT